LAKLETLQCAQSTTGKLENTWSWEYFKPQWKEKYLTCFFTSLKSFVIYLNNQRLNYIIEIRCQLLFANVTKIYKRIKKDIYKGIKKISHQSYVFDWIIISFVPLISFYGLCYRKLYNLINTLYYHVNDLQIERSYKRVPAEAQIKNKNHLSLFLTDYWTRIEWCLFC